MAEMLSPGVFIEEIDASTIVPSVSMSVATFAGEFQKGPVGAYMLISSVDDLIEFYGLPTDQNYNQWYQCYNFLQYGNTLYVSRACSPDSVNAGAFVPSKVRKIKLDASMVTTDTTGGITVIVDASGIQRLRSLEVDHNMEGTLPEFSIYADEANTWGDTKSAQTAGANGVEATFSAGVWTLHFTQGGAAYQAIQQHGGIKFYMLVKDVDGNQTGSMNDGSYLTAEVTI